MYNEKGMIHTATGRWIIAAVIGGTITLLLWVLAGWGFFSGVFAGIMASVVAAFVINLILQPSRGASEDLVESKHEHDAPKTDSVATSAPELVEKSMPNPVDPVETKPLVSKGNSLSTEQEPAVTGVRPDGLLVAARSSGADNLKLIGGVGPKLEETLNGLGIWHFDQIAGLKKRDITWVDERLRFKGRIERDDWIGQAKILAKGGETEFSTKKRKIKEKS